MPITMMITSFSQFCSGTDTGWLPALYTVTDGSFSEPESTTATITPSRNRMLCSPSIRTPPSPGVACGLSTSRR